MALFLWALCAGWAPLCCCCTPAGALILAPRTLAGPNSQIGEFGGSAAAADGGGAVVFTEQVGGIQHVFVSRYASKQWSAPIRVDWETPYAASSPRIGAADGGRLVVVWVAQIATVNGRAQSALYSSTLEPGADSFGEPFLVDPDVGEGQGVNPSLAIASNGAGLVAYRVVTDNFKTSPVQTTIPQLRPGDVLADIRIARYGGQRWFSPVRVNRDPRLSTRPPNESNGPQVGIGRGGEAVVGWQEPESNGSARIWARRVFGTTLGLAMQVSPASYHGQPVTADAGAFTLSVSEFGEAKLVSLLRGAPATALGGPRMFVSTLPVSTSPKGGQFTTPTLLGPANAPPLSRPGSPSVAVDDQGNFRVGFVAGGTARVLRGGESGSPDPELELGPAAGSEEVSAVTALIPTDGGVTAWPALSPLGLPGVGVREDFPDGAAQSALLSGLVDGPISGLAVGGSESGETLLGFREGPPGGYEIVGVPVTAPPPELSMEAPLGWVRPSHARLSWIDAEDATGGVRYSLIVDGHIVQRGIAGLSVIPARRVLGSGVLDVQILATDAAGQQTLSGEVELKIDGSPPVARVRRRGRRVLVSVKDAQSGAVAGATTIAFGDGGGARGRLSASHTYTRPGRYVIVVRMRDRVGNSATAHLRVAVP